MSNRLMPYGRADHSVAIAKVGKKQTPFSLARRMPSAKIAAKVGSPVKSGTPASLAARMPTPEIAAKVGMSQETGIGAPTRVIRRNARPN